MTSMSEERLLLSAAAVFGGVLLLLLLRRVLGQTLRLALRTAVGGGVLAVLSPLGSLIGVQLGVNLANALVLGVLGAPGLGLLLMLHWLVAE